MRARGFLLSFTVTALVVAPFVLEAEAPPQFASVRVAPAPGQDSRVGQLTFHSELVKNDGKHAIIRVTTTNDTGQPVRADVVAALMQRPITSPMARMVPPPREVVTAELKLALAPGEHFGRTITVTLPSGPRAPSPFFTLVRAPAPVAAPQAQFARR
ncbi:MAG TPA: hypothetical protein VL172_13585 [Kofleriaceae bacterium]|nr:hypothetical protein [Kofleriaceae bacterium]